MRLEKHGLGVSRSTGTDNYRKRGTIYRNYTGGAICFTTARVLAIFSEPSFFPRLRPPKGTRDPPKRNENERHEAGRGVVMVFGFVSLLRPFAASTRANVPPVELFREIQVGGFIAREMVNIRVG